MVNGFAPESLREALGLLAEQKPIPYAGGTDLMVKEHDDARFLFLGRVPELRQITDDGQFVRIGAAVTFTEALESSLVPKVMKEAVSRIAAPAIRNAGTFGGNLGNGSGKADSVVVEAAADAKLRLVSLRGERMIDADRFCLGRGKTALAPDELIAEIFLPSTGLEQYYFEKVGGREALAISRVSFAGIYAEKDGRITNIAAAFGAVADRVLRFREAEAILVGKTPEEASALKPHYLEAYADRLILRSGRVSESYRKAVCMNLLNAFLERFGI